jgi:hypothetical protein
VDGASAGALRFLFGTLLVVAVLRYFAHGWIDAQFVRPEFHFAYPGFSWVRPLPPPWMHVLFGVLGVAAAATAVGWHRRVAAAVFAVGFTWAHLCDQANHLNHYYLVTLLTTLLALLPVGRALSLDARVRPRADDDSVHPAALRLLRFQVIAVYVFAGVAKLQPDWLVRAEPLRTWLTVPEGLPVGLPAAWIREGPLAPGLSWAAAAFDLWIPFLVLWPRTRRWAFASLVLFHVATALWFPIGLFPWFMTASATILLDPSWPRRLPWPRRLAAIAVHPSVRPAAPVPWPARVLAAAWVAIQIALPLRAADRPAEVLWTERGFRWSWRVMVMEKAGSAEFRVVDPRAGTVRLVRPEPELTPVQARAMATHPDMVRRYAVHLAESAENVGIAGALVYADVFVSLNDSPSRRLVDPAVDLARADASDASWILPAP